jgi:toxin YoeB
VRLIFSGAAWDDYLHWQATDTKLLVRINDLIGEAMRHPFEGTGKPEPLRGNLKGWWSRRIDREHRLVYRLTGTGHDQALQIAQCRFHY